MNPDPLNQALARFQQLPVDELPDPGPLPPHSRITIGPNPFFTGRTEEFLALAAAVKQSTGMVIHQSAAITGLGGVGKTQLAAEFAYRYGRYFLGGVYWLSFADPAAVPAEIAACGRTMNLPGLDALPLAELVEAVLAEWTSPPRTKNVRSYLR